MAKETLDAVKNAELEAEKRLETAAHRAASIEQDAAQKAEALKTEILKKAQADVQTRMRRAESDAAAWSRTDQRETAALAEKLRQRAAGNRDAAVAAILERITG